MKEYKIKLFKFEELSEKIKEKVHYNLLTDNHYCFYGYELDLNYIIEQLQEIFNIDIDVKDHYSSVFFRWCFKNTNYDDMTGLASLKRLLSLDLSKQVLTDSYNEFDSLDDLKKEFLQSVKLISNDINYLSDFIDFVLDKIKKYFDDNQNYLNSTDFAKDYFSCNDEILFDENGIMFNIYNLEEV